MRGLLASRASMSSASWRLRMVLEDCEVVLMELELRLSDAPEFTRLGTEAEDAVPALRGFPTLAISSGSTDAEEVAANLPVVVVKGEV